MHKVYACPATDASNDSFSYKLFCAKHIVKEDIYTLFRSSIRHCRPVATVKNDICEHFRRRQVHINNSSLKYSFSS